jgi:hypothetical protein
MAWLGGPIDSNRRIRYLLQTGAHGTCCKQFQFQLQFPNPLNILINGVLDGIEKMGCEVPGCVDMLVSMKPLRVPGQLFADDTVGLAPSLDNLHAMFAHFAQWAEDHYMGFGVKNAG